MLLVVAQTEAQLHYHAVSIVKPTDRLGQDALFNILLYIAADGVAVGAEHVGEQQLVSVPVHVQRLVERDLLPLR